MTPKGIASGARVGPYQIVARLSQGGMTTLFLGLERERNRMVVLKVLRCDDSVLNGELLTRFGREVEILRRIEDPHVVRILGGIERCPGGCYFTLEFIRGQNLEAFLSRHGALPLDDVGRLLGQIGRGLEAIHRIGVVHRDLKPANVMLDEQQSARIIDFGLSIASDLARVTTTGHLVGTPRYMALEQLQGTTDLDARTDVFALGAIAYEMLAGGPAFPQTGMSELIRDKGLGHWAPIAMARPDAPAGWDDWMGRTLAPAREARFPTIAEAIAAIPR